MTDSLVGLDRIIPTVRKLFSQTEIKFSKTGDRIKSTVLRIISQRDLEIFSLVVNAEGKNIADTPENYSLILSKLLSAVKRKHPKLKHVIIDRHFTWVEAREKFNELVQKKVGAQLFIEHLDSQQNTIVSLPDFVAGVIREYYMKKNSVWRDLLEKRVVYEKVISWRKLKQQKR